jgi:predicted acyltransferase
MGVLQRIAICYFFASIIFLHFRKVGQQVYLAALILFSYWILMKFVPVPGYGVGILEREGNLAQYIDYLILKGHMWQKTWDPEGFLSTVPAIATTLLGVSGGQYLRSNHPPLRKTINLFLFGTLLLVIGIVWNIWFPINRILWTSSYAAFTSGTVALFLATCHYLIDVRKLTSWTKVFVIFGMNSIAVYVLSETVSRILGDASIALVDGTATTLKTFLYEHFFASWAGPLDGSLLYALTYVTFWLGIMSMFYKKRVFIKI